MSRANEPAYPCKLPFARTFPTGSSIASRTEDHVFHGLTLREYYAGLAMQGLLAANVPGVQSEGNLDPRVTLAIAAVNCADALLAELAKERT